MGEHGTFTRPPIAAGETEAQWDSRDMCDICQPLLWPHLCFLLPPHSPVPPCTPFQPCCILRWAVLERGRTRTVRAQCPWQGWHSTSARVGPPGTQLCPSHASQDRGWVDTGAWQALEVGAVAAPGWDSTRALHAPAPLPWGTRQPGLCPRPFVWHLLPAPTAAPDHGLEPLRGSGCDPSASGKDEIGIPNGQQPPKLAVVGVLQLRQQRGQE